MLRSESVGFQCISCSMVKKKRVVYVEPALFPLSPLHFLACLLVLCSVYFIPC